MNPDDDDLDDNFLKQPKSAKTTDNCLNSFEDRRIGRVKKRDLNYAYNLQAFAEDELVRKEYKEMRCDMPGMPRSTFLMVFSPDGTKVASTHGNHNIYVTDIRSGKNINTLIGHPRTPWCIAFHPTSNQIVASGCLGGQVRIWDLSGGSEVWTTGNQSVIASIAFHPNDRILVIATCNEVYFWDWSKPEPFIHTATSNPKEKVRYVAFDKLGHKLITGIANSPQTRWERVRAPVPVPRQAERSASPYRRRITPRLVTNVPPTSTQSLAPGNNREPLSSVPERERRITACYRNLVHEYELLVHRYLQVYRQPAMVDRGTDPMEPTSASSGTQTSAPSTSESVIPEPSTSSQPDVPVTSNEPPSISSSSLNPTTSTSPLMSSSFHPLRRKPKTLIRGTQTSENTNREQSELVHRRDETNNSDLTSSTSNQPPNQRRLLIITSTAGNEINVSNQLSSSSSPHTTPEKSAFKMRIRCSPRRRSSSVSYDELRINEMRKRFKSSVDTEQPQPSTSGLQNIPKPPDVPSNVPPDVPSDVPESITEANRRRQEAKRRFGRGAGMRTIGGCHSGHPRNRMKWAYLRRCAVEISSDSSSSDDEDTRLFTRTPVEPQVNQPTGESAINYNTELEHLVTNLLTNFEPLNSSTLSGGNNNNNNSEGSNDHFSFDRFSSSLRNAINNFNTSQSATTSSTCTNPTMEPCARTIVNTNTRTTNSTIYTNSNHQRRRLGANRVSAFLPTRVPNRPQFRRHFFSPLRNHISNLESRISGSFAPDEVINYSERVNEDESNEQSVDFHPFDPPPEVPTINPENIGIGNMYSNIVQDLESSLTDVQNIRASNRPGETSDMLSSFSERLESIMNQSDTILRNLRQSMDTLTPNPRRQSPLVDNEREEFYLRDNTYRRNSVPETFENVANVPDVLTNRNAIAIDHTYPRNPNNTRGETSNPDNMTPLMTSLHVTISHIQRQARLLRRQVESIEHIDRAMLEVAQLQTIRQLYVDMYRHLSSLGESRVSSVRQMMAGTRISDSSPDESPTDDSSNQNPASSRNVEHEPGPGPSNVTDLHRNLTSRNRVVNRKTYPPSRLLRMQRQSRRPSLTQLLPRLYVPRSERLTRRSSTYLQSLPNRGINRAGSDLFSSRTIPERLYINHSLLNSDALTTMTLRLERLLMDQTKLVGRVVEPSSEFRRDLGEHIINLRLNDCRLRLNRILRRTDNTNAERPFRNESSSVTQDGVSRYSSRHTLSVIVDTLSRYFEENGGSSISSNVQQQIECVLALSLLLTEMLLLQIVDSIPPPTGMNLEPERECLSSRIDQICTQILESRLIGQSQQLSRSLRLMRMAVRHATQTLRNHHNCRRELLMGSLNRCLRNLRRRRESRQPRQAQASTSSNSSDNAPPVIEWYRTINELISRYTNEVSRLDEEASRSNSNEDNSNVNAETGEQFQISRYLLNNIVSGSQINSDEDNDAAVGLDTSNSQENVSTSRETASRTLYRTNNVNLLNNEEPSTSTQSRPWNVPSVHVNDIPIAESNLLNQPPSYWPPSLRLSDTFSDLRGVHPTIGLFRPRFLHPLYGGVNPFDADRDDAQREQIYDIDMITTVTPNHRIQVWDISSGNIPVINNPLKNVVVSECKIHNDASVDIAADGTILVTLLPSGGYLNVTNRLGVYSLRWETLGQCLYITSFEQNAVSVSLSPLSRHLVVGLASRRVSIVPSDKWTMARIFLLDENEAPYGRLPVLRELEQSRDSRASNYKSVNCIRWLPVSGQGLVYATNTGQLVVLT